MEEVKISDLTITSMEETKNSEKETKSEAKELENKEPAISPEVCLEEGVYYFACPHCGGGVEVLKKEVNCAIFRHGFFKKKKQQINPHLPAKKCAKLRESGKVIGCCKPFRLLEKEKKVEICEYI